MPKKFKIVKSTLFVATMFTTQAQANDLIKESDYYPSNSSYSKEDFNNKWFWDFLKLIESKLNEIWHDKDDIKLLLENIVDDLESWDTEWVRIYLSDEWLNKDLIDSIINKMPKTLAIAPELINNLWNVDMDKVIDEYVKTWIIPEWYISFESYFKKIWASIKERNAIIERWKKAEKDRRKAREMLKMIEEIKKKIRNSMKDISLEKINNIQQWNPEDIQK